MARKRLGIRARYARLCETEGVASARAIVISSIVIALGLAVIISGLSYAFLWTPAHARQAAGPVVEALVEEQDDVVCLETFPLIHASHDDPRYEAIRTSALEIYHGSDAIVIPYANSPQVASWIYALNCDQDAASCETSEDGAYTILHVDRAKADKAFRGQKLAFAAIEELGIHDGDDQYITADKLANWLEDIADYDETYTRNDATDALEGSSLCAGFSLAYKMLCEICGMDAWVVLGTTCNWDGTDDGDDTLHAWNKVKIGEQWFYVDTCWNGDFDFEYDVYGLSLELWGDHREGIPETYNTHSRLQENRDAGLVD